MTISISDEEAPFPIVRKERFVEADKQRTITTKTVVIPATTQGGTEEKSKFSIRIFSMDADEDLISLIITLQQFRSWAEVRDLWEAAPNVDVRLLFTEFKKCLSGQAEQQWQEIEQRRVSATTSRTFILFKSMVAEFVVKKVAQDPAVYFKQYDYLLERRLPSNIAFRDYYNTLTLYSSYLPWLLDEDQIIQLESINHPLPFERQAAARARLWKAGRLSNNQLRDIVLRAIPQSWMNQFSVSGGSHKTPLETVIERMSAIEGVSRRQRGGRTQEFRGGGRRNQNNRGRSNQSWRGRNYNYQNYANQNAYGREYNNFYYNNNRNYQGMNNYQHAAAPVGAQRNQSFFRGSGNSTGRGYSRGGFRGGGNYNGNWQGRGGRPGLSHSQGGRGFPNQNFLMQMHSTDLHEESMNQEEDVYQNAISCEEELLEHPRNEMFFQQDESFDLGFATNTETQGGEYVRSPDEEQYYEDEEHEYYQPYETEYEVDDTEWNDDFSGWQHQDDYW